MNKPSKAEMSKTLDSFQIIDDAPQRTILDRSLIEAYSVCPWQAHAIETADPKFVVGQLAVAGQLAHDCFNAATKLWIESNMGVSVRDLVAEIENAAVSSRPDLQPDVIRSTKSMAWDWAEYLMKYGHINNILAFDGGEELDRSGQMSMAFGNIEFTSEVDFLRMAGTEAFEDDWKTGWKDWSDDDVKDSFQFQSHAALIFHNFPTLDTLYVRVWNTRRHTRTPWCAFYRRDVGRYVARISSAIGVRMSGDTTPWPTVEKCRICPVSKTCPAADTTLELTTDPVALGQRLVALEAAYEATKDACEAHIDAMQRDIELPGGVRVGRNKPRPTTKSGAEKKQPVAIYQINDWADPPFAKEKP